MRSLISVVSAGVLSMGCTAENQASPKDTVVPDASEDAPTSDSGADAGPTGPLAIPLSGCGPFYTAQVTLGDTQTFPLAVDIGSSTTAVAAVGCTSCKTDGVAKLYDPANAMSLSQTGKGVYGSITWTGPLYQDVVRVGSDGTQVPVKLAAITFESGLFFNACEVAPADVPAGILGLGTSDQLAPGTTNYLDAYKGVNGEEAVFAVRLCHRGGTLWLGGYDPSSTTGPMQFTPLKEQDGHNVTLKGFAVGAVAADLAAPSLAVLDTGGYNLFIPAGPYQTLVKALAADPSFKQQFGDASWFLTTTPTTLATTPADLDAKLPPLTVKLDGLTVELPASTSYVHWFVHPAGGYDYVPAMFSDPSLLDLGDAFMHTNVLFFDRKNARVGLAPAQPCPP